MYLICKIPWPLEDFDYFYFCSHAFHSFMKFYNVDVNSKQFSGE